MPASADDLLESFLARVEEKGLELYPAQEEAVLEIFAGNHVILNTPTGSGKSLVALAMHHRSLALGRRCIYTSPIKALVSEKFFALCEDLGAQNVGMQTGDTTINADAPIVCCTAEILANIALRSWDQAPVDDVVMDEFHYFADADRGMAWQIPLLTLPQATFLLMSATLGDVSAFEKTLKDRTGKPVSVVRSKDRPVPLDFNYQEIPLHETISELLERDKTPIYLVCFTQRECFEQAQNLTSLKLIDKPRRKQIADAIGSFTFDSAAGKEVRRFVTAGIGVHNAGLLPKYRLLVEKLAQQGLLTVICGTDTLGVGINVPIRTVVFSKLCKFDGEQMGIVKIRDFQQIAGRAGRKGYDTQGTVAVQAPDHVVENKKAELKISLDPKKKRKFVRKKPPERGYAHWDQATFKKLVESDPEPLRSRFTLSHGLLVNCLDREVSHGRRDGGYRRVLKLIELSYDRSAKKSRHRRYAAVLFRSLREAGVIELVRVPWSKGPAVQLATGLQREFSLFHALSLYLVEAIAALDGQHEDYARDVLSLVEAIIESPRVILRAQLSKLKDDLVAQMKADGVEYEQRMEKLDAATPPRPCEEFIEHTFEAFRKNHPWVGADRVEPKSIARDMFESYMTFNQFVGKYGLARSEGVLFRYLGQAYKVLVHTVPAEYRTQELDDLLGFFRATLSRIDASLVREWESMVTGGDASEADGELGPDPAALKRIYEADVRAQLHLLVKHLAGRDYEEAAELLGGGDAKALEEEMAPVHEECGELSFGHAARFHRLTSFAVETQSDGEEQSVARQILVNDEGQTPWVVECRVHERDDGARRLSWVRVSS